MSEEIGLRQTAGFPRNVIAAVIVRRRRLTLLALLLSASAVFATEKPRVAVVPFTGIEVSKSDSAGMTLLFETAIQNTGCFDLIEQTRAEAILEAQEYSLTECADESCAVEIGRLLSAEQILMGTVGRLGGLYYLNVKVIDVQTGRNMSAQKARAETLESLVFKIEELASALADAISSSLDKMARVGKAAALEPNDNLDRKANGGLVSPDRYRDNKDGTVTDAVNNVMWQKAVSFTGTFNEFRRYCVHLSVGGYDDWRLPTKLELETLYRSLVDEQNPDARKGPFEWNSVARYWAATFKVYMIDFITGEIEEIAYDRTGGETCAFRAVRTAQEEEE